MEFEKFIVRRYLKPRSDNLFVAFIGIISILGVTLGVTAIILTLAILNGFEREIKSRFIGFDAHVRILRVNDQVIDTSEVIRKKIKNSDIQGKSAFIVEKAMVTSRGGNHVSFVKGVNAKDHLSVTDLADDMIAGKFEFQSHESDLDGIVLGFSMALRLDVTTGDTVTVISPVGVTSPFSTPLAKRFMVTGVFKTDMFEYDHAFAFVTLRAAQYLFDVEAGSKGIDLRLNNIEDSFEIQSELQASLGTDYKIETWFDQHADLYSAMKLEKWGSLILLSMIIMVAGFNIVSTLIMVVMQKTNEIGILKSMGASQAMISLIFMRQGLLVGGAGILAGSLIGYGICFLQITFEFIKLPGEIFFLDAVPIDLLWQDFVAVVSVALILCLVSTIYPARQAAKLTPIEALKT